MLARCALIAYVSVGLAMSAVTTVRGQYTAGGMFGSRTLGATISGRSNNLATAGPPRNSVGLAMSAVTTVRGQYTASGMFGSRTLGSTISDRSNNLATAAPPRNRLKQQEGIGQVTGPVGRGTGTLGGGICGTSGMGLPGTSGRDGMNQRGAGQLGDQRGANGTEATGGMRAFGGISAGRGDITRQTPTTIDFRYRQLPTAKTRSAVERRLNSSARIQKVGPIRFEVVGRTATLRGVVAKEEDRELALRMAELEPGISEVLDELSVASPDAPTPTDSPDR